MSGPISGALGEGASDVVAFLVNGDDAIAEYSASSAGGIRRAPYGSYTLTYANVNGQEVHNDGEIYAAAMWRLRTAWQGAPYPLSELFDAFVDGMNFTPSSPSYEDMRNGLLESINATFTGAAATDRCALVWNAFASIGIGDGSSATINPDGTVTTTPAAGTRSNCTH